jgi:hypothetical protein
MNSSRVRYIFLLLLCLTIISGIGYYFITKTNRGSSILLYVVGGWSAPTGVKWECAHETDRRVEEKFKLPLAFDEETKNQLRGFWYYSYFRDCLAAYGYDFSGRSIPSSTLVQDGAPYTYSNIYGGYSFTLTEDARIIEDNTLNVDYDDRLFASTLKVAGQKLAVDTYQKYEDIGSFEELIAIYDAHPLSYTPRESLRVATSTTGMRTLIIKEVDTTTRIVGITPSRKLFDIHGMSLNASLIETITTSLEAVSE